MACDTETVGDGDCNPDCDIPECLHDGGDCHVMPEVLLATGTVDISLQTSVFTLERKPQPSQAVFMEGVLDRDTEDSLTGTFTVMNVAPDNQTLAAKMGGADPPKLEPPQEKAPYGIFNQQDAGNGLKLYVKRVFIMDDCKDLLPTWLRFVRGIVDSEDLPLNVSREILQNNKLVNQIKTHITKKVLTELKKTAENDAESYNAFWKELGNVLKEGFYMNWEHLDELKKLLRFESSQTGALTSLTDYVARMQADQKEIYFITGESKAAVANSPHLEVFKEKGIEVLYLVDSIDEWVVQGLNEFDGKSLKDVTKGDLDIQDEKDKEEQKENEGKFEKLLKSLGAKIEGVKEVRLTSRLKDSPAVLVADEHGMGANMERIMKMTNQSFESQERILELNPKHILSEKLLQAYEADENSDDVSNWSIYLYGQALIAEGSELPNPVEHVQLVNKMLAKI
jgi:molecular chaperone HtpG